jgi:hypothetical protein
MKVLRQPPDAIQIKKSPFKTVMAGQGFVYLRDNRIYYISTP